MRISSVLAIALSLVCLFVAVSGAWAQETVQARIHLADKEQGRDIFKLNLDVAYVEYGRYVDIITHREEVEVLRSAGYDVEIIHEDLTAFYQSRFDPAKDMGGYHTYAEVGAVLGSMHALYPLITSDTMTIGLSLQGRSIWAFKISDNPDVDDIFPFERYESSVSLSDAIADTFFWISGQPEGTYFYKVRAKDTQAHWSLWSNVEMAILVPGFTRGDANGDGLINLGDITCLATYLYRNGSAPSPPEAGAPIAIKSSISLMSFILSIIFLGMDSRRAVSRHVAAGHSTGRI